MQTYVYKIVIGGAGGVGKTTLLCRYLTGIFKTDTAMTIGVTFFNKDVNRSGTCAKLAIWDLGGQDRFRMVQPQYVNGAKAAIIFFDMARLQTIMQIEEWLTMFRTSANPSIPVFLCGTKQDLLPPDAIKRANEEAMEIVASRGFTQYYQTSAKTGLNVEAVFDHVVDLLLAQSSVQMEARSNIANSS